MLHICLLIPDMPSLNIDWATAMEMEVSMREELLKRILELREQVGNRQRKLQQRLR